VDSSHRDAPELSVVIVTPDDYASIRRTMGLLAAQSARDRLEVVIVAPSETVLAAAQEHVGSALRVRVAPVERVESVGAANAAGVRAAQAPLVAFVEEHSYPDVDWAAALIAAHAGRWAVVGPVARNANPHTLVSWADFAITYGPWAEGHAAGAVQHLPGHNSSYKRAVLLSLADDLETLLGAESVLHWQLVAQGESLYLEPAARIAHVNFGLLRPWLVTQWHTSRVFASVRAQRWPVWRRVVYMLGAPLIPCVRLVRTVRQQRVTAPAQRPPGRTWPVILLGLGVSACGELVGYASGAGRASQRLTDLEFHRLRYVPTDSKPND